MEEEWRPVVGWEGYYEVSNQGRVRSLDRVVIDVIGRPHPIGERIMRPRTNWHYVHHLIPLSRGGLVTLRPLHHLVLEAFVGPRPEGMEGLHWDDDPTNNAVENLRWGTRSENLRDAVRNGGHFQAKKTHCPRGHALIEPNLVPSKAAVGYRECLACKRERDQARRNRRAFDSARADERYERLVPSGSGLEAIGDRAA